MVGLRPLFKLPIEAPYNFLLDRTANINPTEMTTIIHADQSNGYESVSEDFMSIRSRSAIGVATARNWAKSLPQNASVLDLACGHGLPISKTLIDEGIDVYGIDASPSLIVAFRSRFPNTPVECGAIEESDFFGRRFEGIIAWGLIFLLAPDVQITLLHKIALALMPGGKFLFTAPHQACEWLDNLTGRRSVSLGSDEYRKIVESEGLVLVDESEDEGQNHYYFVCKPDGTRDAL